MPYFLIMFMCSMTVLLYDNNEIDNKNKNMLVNTVFFFLIISLIFIGGFRDNIGADFNSYVCKFDDIPVLSKGFFVETEQIHGEIGYKLLNSFIKTIGLNNHMYLFVIIIIICIMLNINSLNKYTEHFYIGFYVYICLYFWGREMGQVRQAIATALCFYSIRYIKDRNLMKFLLMALLATTFHTTSIIIIPFYFISHKEFKKSFYIMLIIIGIILTNIDWIGGAYPLLFKLFPKGAKYIGGIYGYKTSILSFQWLRRLLPAFLAIIGMNKLKDKYEYYIISLNLIIFGTFLSLLFHEVGIFVERLFVPLTFVEILIYSYFIDYFNNKYYKNVYKFLIIIYGIIFVVNLLSSRSYDFFPYQNYILELFY